MPCGGGGGGGGKGVPCRKFFYFKVSCSLIAYIVC